PPLRTRPRLIQLAPSAPVAGLFVLCHGDHRGLHSFPTRRSSDLSAWAYGQAFAVTLAQETSTAWRWSAGGPGRRRAAPPPATSRSEEHTSELQSRVDLVCRLLLEKKNMNNRVANVDRKPCTRPPD